MLTMKLSHLSWPILSLLLAFLATTASAQQVQPVSLISPGKERGGWNIGLGQEFPGAKGELKVTEEKYRDQSVLSLSGDFRGGGLYIDAQVKLPAEPVDEISFWLNPPAGTTSVPIRLIDGSGQCHQLKLKLSDKGGWQQIVFPVDEYFRKVGTASALDLTSNYEKWGGANDGRWHQPGKNLIVLCTKDMGEQPEIQLADVSVTPAPPTTKIEKSIPLDEILQLGEVDWKFNLGREFPGAKGEVSVVKDEPKAGNNAMKLSADFTAGGAYVGIGKDFKSLAVEVTNAIRMKMRSKTTSQFGVRLVDATGQCHQRTAITLKADGEWQEMDSSPPRLLAANTGEVPTMANGMARPRSWN